MVGGVAAVIIEHHPVRVAEGLRAAVFVVRFLEIRRLLQQPLAQQAVQHLVLVHETLGLDWLTPDLHRFGASSLLNDVLMQIRKEKTGRYQSPDYFTVD